MQSKIQILRCLGIVLCIASPLVYGNETTEKKVVESGAERSYTEKLIYNVNGFLQELKNDDILTAHELLNPALKHQVNIRDLTKFAQDHSLIGLESWKTIQGRGKNNENGIYHLNSVFNIVNSDLEEIHVGLNLSKLPYPLKLKNSDIDAVRVNSIYIPATYFDEEDQKTRFYYAPAIPSKNQLDSLLKTNIQLFSKSLQAYSVSLLEKDFVDFQHSTALGIRQHKTPAAIGNSFKHLFPYADKLVELSKNSKIELNGEPSFRTDGTFDVQFAFESNLEFVQIDQRYIYEGFEWKLMEIQLKKDGVK